MRTLPPALAALMSLMIAATVRGQPSSGDVEGAQPPGDDTGEAETASIDSSDEEALWEDVVPEDGDDGADAVGFADVSEEEVAGSPSPTVSSGSEEPSAWTFIGAARSQWALWVERFDDDPWAKGRQSLDLSLSYGNHGWRGRASLHAEYDLRYVVDRDRFGRATRDAYEWLVYLDETFLSWAGDAVDVTVGRQIVAWGQGDVVSPIDVVTPRDLREPGLADLEDLRLPVWATRVGVSSGYHRVEGMVIHVPSFGYRSPPLGPFSPFRALLEDGTSGLTLPAGLEVRYDDEPDEVTTETQQLLLRWSYRGPAVDLGLYLASVLDQSGVIDGFDIEPATLSNPDAAGAGGGTRAIHVKLKHSRHELVGHAGTLPLGDWLLEWEAYFDRRFVNAGDPSLLLRDGIRVEPVRSAGGMLGMTYSGLQDTRIVVELGKSWLVDDVQDPLFPLEEPTFAFRVSHLALRQDLELTAAATVLGWTADLGWVARAEASYRLGDGWRVGLGYITYQPGDRVSFIWGLDRHDRLFASLRFDFRVF